VRAPGLRTLNARSFGSPAAAPRRFLDSPWLVVLMVVGALAVAYLLSTRASTEFYIYLIWALAVTALAVAFAIRYDATHRTVWVVLAVGLMVKLFGSLARYEVFNRVYEGSADAGPYFDKGLEIARGLWHLDLTALFSPEGATSGTRFLTQVSGVIVSISGPSLRAAFLVFSLLAFAGVLFFAGAYKRVPGAQPVSYLTWMVLWPSLFFWPSSVGKEAFLLFAIGLAVWGYSLFPRPAAWVALAAGLLLIGLTRPHVAGVLGLAMLSGAVMARTRGRLVGRWYFQVVFFAAAFAGTFYLSAGALGIESTESAVQMVEQQAAQSNVGGSAAGEISLSPLQIPNALLRALFRPYPWEASSPMMLISALEIVLLVALGIWRRKQLWASLRGWRQDRLIAFSLVFVILYALMLGFAMSNLAIIARQRALMLPMLLLLLQARSSKAPKRARDA